MPTIILTRSAADNARVAQMFAAPGVRVVSVPMIELRTLPADECGLRAVCRVSNGLPVLITSSYAAELWLDLRETDFADAHPQAYFGVGKLSAELLRKSDPNVPVRVVATSGSELLRADLQGITKLLYPCSLRRRDELVNGLKNRGIGIIELPLYETIL